MTKTPPKKPPLKAPPKPAVKEFVPKTFIMLPTQRAKELVEQINKLRQEHPELFKGPLGDLLDLIYR